MARKLDVKVRDRRNPTHSSIGRRIGSYQGAGKKKRELKISVQNCFDYAMSKRFPADIYLPENAEYIRAIVSAMPMTGVTR